MTDNNQRVNEQASEAGAKTEQNVQALFEPFSAAELDEMEAVALAAPMTWYGTYQITDGISDEKAVELIEACSPHSIITLVRQARAALAHPVGQQGGESDFSQSAPSSAPAADRAQSDKAAAANAGGLPDHVIRETVNQLRDIAIKYHAAGQLREQIAYLIVPLLKDRAAATSAGGLPDHVIRETVNQLRDIAIKYHAAGQLREQIAYLIVPLLKDRTAAVGAGELKPYTFASNYCDCHPETCACDPYKVLNPDGSRLCTAFSRQSAERVVEQLNRDTGRAAAKGTAVQAAAQQDAKGERDA